MGSVAGPQARNNCANCAFLFVWVVFWGVGLPFKKNFEGPDQSFDPGCLRERIPDVRRRSVLKTFFFHVYLNSVQQMVSGEFGTGASPHTVCWTRLFLFSVQLMMSGEYCKGVFPGRVCWEGTVKEHFVFGLSFRS